MQHQDIIDNLRNGNTQNLKRLYRYFPVVKKWLIAHGCPKHQTLDIYQEALVVFCNKCRTESFTLTASIDTYLFAVSRNIFMSQSRKEARQNVADFAELDHVAADDYQDWQEKEQRLHYAMTALESIGEKCREILQMFYLQGKSMLAIASEMGFRSEKVAKTRKYKCLTVAKQKALNLLMNE